MKYFKGFAWETVQLMFICVCRYFVVEVAHQVIRGLVPHLFDFFFNSSIFTVVTDDFIILLHFQVYDL
jgi:hypothetical protein